jgi:hypothetical protein
MKPILAALMALLLLGQPSYAQHSGSRASHHSASSRTYHARSHSTRRYSGVARDRHGRIKRSESAKRDFESRTGYPHGRPGYVVDHIKPLACGGADDPSNMQWQTKAEAKAKDKWERKGCK